jgi:hypothetical protein
VHKGVNFKDFTSVTLGNAAALELTNVRFTTTSVLVATALTVSGVTRAELNGCAFTGGRATQAAVSFANCGSVVVNNTDFNYNQANIVGGIKANDVAALAITDSTFAFNSGGCAPTFATSCASARACMRVYKLTSCFCIVPLVRRTFSVPSTAT